MFVEILQTFRIGYLRNRLGEMPTRLVKAFVKVVTEW